MITEDGRRKLVFHFKKGTLSDELAMRRQFIAIIMKSCGVKVDENFRIIETFREVIPEGTISYLEVIGALTNIEKIDQFEYIKSFYISISKDLRKRGIPLKVEHVFLLFDKQLEIKSSKRMRKKLKIVRRISRKITSQI